MKRLTFLIAIDAYLLRKGIIALLNKIPGISVISETGSADNLKNLVSQHQPDFLPPSFKMPLRSMIQTIDYTRKRFLSF